MDSDSINKFGENLTNDQRELLDKITLAVADRLSGKRLEHSYGTALTAAQIARIYGVDEYLAYVVGMLHDWDKGLSGTELLESCMEFDIDLPGDPNNVMPLIHAWTGAFRVIKMFPELPQEVFVAISRHTTGAARMGKLDMVLYIADKIEPHRGNPTELAAIRSMVGISSLEQLFITTYGQSLTYLLETQRYIYPLGVDIWNAIIKRKDETKPIYDPAELIGFEKDVLETIKEIVESTKKTSKKKKNKEH